MKVGPPIRRNPSAAAHSRPTASAASSALNTPGRTATPVSSRSFLSSSVMAVIVLNHGGTEEANNPNSGGAAVTSLLPLREKVAPRSGVG